MYCHLSSGGARVFAARGERLCCRPTNQIGSAIRVFFRISDIGGVNQPCGPLPLPSHLIPSTSLPSAVPILSFPIPPLF